MLQHEIRGNLAKLLAVENIIVEHKSVEGACFDVVERVLTLPLWDKASEDVYQMLILHEVGHAKYTPTEEWVSNYEKYGATLNILEDARIEKLIKVKYPGSRKTFHSAYKELFESDFFKITDIDSYNFIDRINLYFKVGTHVKVNFNDSEKVVIERIEKSSTFEDILDICKEIYDLVKSNMSMNIQVPPSNYEMGTGLNGSDSVILKTNIQNDSIENSKPSGKNSNNLSGSKDNDVSNESTASGGDNDDQNDTTEDNSNTNESDVKDSNDQNSTQNDSESLKDILDSETYKNFSESIKTLSDMTVGSIKYVEVPKLNIDNIIVSNDEVHKKLIDYLENSDFIKLNFQKFKETSKREVSYMVKEFESKKSADLFMRSKESKTGVLDCTRLFSYKYNENIFKSVTTVPEGKNHGLIFILDWSGSMTGCIMDTYKQLCCLMWFCKKVNIPFDVYCFVSNYNEDHKYQLSEIEKNKLSVGGFKLNNIISSKNKKISVETQIYNMFSLISGRYWDRIPDFRMGGTPLNESLIALNHIIPKFIETTKVQKLQCVVLTDGEANYTGVCNSKRRGDVSHICEGSFVRDKNLKTTYKVLSGYSYLTNPLLKNLTDKFPYCNFIGIRLISEHYLTSFLNQQNIPDKYREKYRQDWSSNGSCSVESTGYFKYFAMKTSSMRLNSDFDFEDKTEKQIKNEFRRKLSKRQTNKKLLSEFIQIIS